MFLLVRFRIGLLSLALLAGFEVSSLAVTYPVAWTIQSQGTETWFSSTVIYDTASLDVQGTNPTNCAAINPAQQTITAGMSGQAYFAFTNSATSGVCGSARISISNAGISSQVTNSDLFLTVSSNGSFQVTAGQSYTITAVAQGGGSRASIIVDIPHHVQSGPQSAPVTGSGGGSGLVNAGGGETNLGGFYAFPSPRHGGSVTGVLYRLSWDNPNVVMFFSDTRTTNTGNHFASVIATTSRPYQGFAQPAPGRIRLDWYDEGGEGLAFHDTDFLNQLGTRPGGVDVSYNTNSGAVVLGNTMPGEWINYSINVSTSAYYSFVFSAALASTTNGHVHIEIDGVNVTRTMTITNTGSLAVYQPVTATNIFLTDGYHLMRLVMDSPAPGTGNGNFSAIDIIGPPRITSITQTNGNVTIRAMTVPTYKYRLEYATNLPATTWFPIGSTVTAASVVTPFTDSPGSIARRFYRVVQLQ